MNDKGFTLIEMLVAISISSMIMIGLVVFMSVSSRSYKVTEDEVAVQTEGQNAMNIISNLIMEGSNFEYNKNGAIPEEGVDTSKLVTGKTYLAFKTDDKETSVVMNYIVCSNNKLYYYKKTYNKTMAGNEPTINRAGDISSAISNDNLMADYINGEEFNLKINKEVLNDKTKEKVIKNIYVELGLNRNGKHMTIRNTVKPRNKLDT